MNSDTPPYFVYFVDAVRRIYGEGFIPLHRPIFEGNEKKYLIECIDSNFVSTAGKKVEEFESLVAAFVGSKFAVATSSGTTALHTGLIVSGVVPNDEVITQAVTFVATCNAIAYCGANPVFVDVDRDSMGMSPSSLQSFLEKNIEIRDDISVNKNTGKVVRACVPMHTYGMPCRIAEIAEICEFYNITLVEDAAESLGSFYQGTHTGNFGLVGAFSFNGNKIITTGGGGMLITDDEKIARRAKHITTTAKLPHSYKFLHDEIGYNYRLPNLNAALGCAQMEKFPHMLKIKHEIANHYLETIDSNYFNMVVPIDSSVSNNWLNSIVFNEKKEHDSFLEFTNKQGIMTRPLWGLMSELDMFKNCYAVDLVNSHWLAERVVNIPSSVPHL